MFYSHLFTLPNHLTGKIRLHAKRADAQLSLFGKILTAHALEHFGIPAQIMERMTFDKFNRPFIPNIRFDFNISHSGKYVVCASSTSYKVGLDIEKISFIDLSDFVAHLLPVERGMIESSTRGLTELFFVWTKKEAVIKGDGRGIYVPLNTIDTSRPNVLLDDTCWFLTEIPIHEEYVCHLATNSPLHENVMLVELRI